MKLIKDINARIDELEEAMSELPEAYIPVSHKFVGDIYVREVFMPAGTLVCSRIHQTTHPYMISMGVVHVKVNDNEWEVLEAPFSGVTNAGTRRVLYIEQDTLWSTFHALKEGEATHEQVEARILEKHYHPFIENKKKVEALT